MAPDELADRIGAARHHIQTVAGDLVEPSVGGPNALAARANRLHRLWATVSLPALTPGPGTRGRLGFQLKRVVRRCTAWYVEPRWAGQHEIDAELARFASDTSAALDELRSQVARLEESNGHLRRDLHQARRSIDEQGDT